MTDTAEVEPKPFTPTQSLILDILAARYRLGENLWTFGSHLSKAAEQLAARDLVFTTHGITERTIRVGLTETGKAATLSPDYQPPPAVRHLTERQLVAGLEYSRGWAEPQHGLSEASRGYWRGMRDTLRVVLGVTTGATAVSADNSAAIILLGDQR